MKVDGKATRTIWLEPDGWSVGIIDQTRLPHRFITARLTTLEDAARAIAATKKAGAPVQVLTHCNAGWLATVDFGTALAPIYVAHDDGAAVHVWVDETRPRNQGAALTAWELGQHGVAHTVIPDNTGGHLMQHGMVDIVLVGA